jgi:hypothetical protein
MNMINDVYISIERLYIEQVKSMFHHLRQTRLKGIVA